MSKCGNCLDNASIETFFGHIKGELDYKECKSFEDVKSKVIDYVIHYNQQRGQ